MFKKSLLCLAALLTGAVQAENLIKNGDFSSGKIAPWLTPQTKTLHKIKEGKIVVTGDPTHKYNGFITMVQYLPKLEKGKKYLLTAEALPQIKSVGNKWAKIVIRQADKKGVTINYTGSSVDLRNSKLQKLQTVFTPAANAVLFQVYIQTSAFEKSDLLTIDNLSLDIAPELKKDQQNLVQNGNFEHHDFTPWFSAFLKQGFFKLSGDTAFGKQCLTVSGDKSNKYNKFVTLIQQLPVLDPEKEYVLSARMHAGLKDIKGKKLEVAVRQATDKDQTISYKSITANLSDDSWKYHELMFQPSKQAGIFQLYIIVSGLDKDDLAAVDEIKLAVKGGEGAPFNAGAKVSVPVKKLAEKGVCAEISTKTNLLHKLVIDGVVIQPGAKASTVVAVTSQDGTFDLDGKNSPNGGFQAKAEYSFKDGMFREVVTVTALKDFADPVRISVRHGLNTAPWQKHLGALRPMRVRNINEATIFSYLGDFNDLNPGILEQYQHTAYPLTILEGKDHYLIAGSRSLDDFVTLSPNYPAGYIPSLQRNPKTVKKGDTFRFENNWKLFSRKEVMLRDVWRFYQEHLQTANPVLGKFLPPKFTERRHFYPGIFGSHTYFLKEREERLPDGANVWFYSWHDNIRERYPISGSWWSDGNSYKEKINADYLKAYMKRLQTERKFNLIFYLRQLANLRERDRGAFPDSWYKRSPGGALHLYGGGYTVKLREHVAKDVGYDSIPWGQHNFANPDFRKFYLDEIFTAINFYEPRAIGWDMGSDLDEFSVIAETYTRLRNAGGKIKAVANESAGPTQAYADMVLLENGLLGGKSAYDFEIARTYTTSVVCLERWNIFQLAFDHHTTGRKVWLNANGLKENKRYFDYLLSRRPELKNQRNETARLCQLRASIYDLALGASPGYMEEAKPVPPALFKVAGEINGLFAVNRSFAVTFPNRSNIDGYKTVSAWNNDKSFRLAAFNDQAKEEDFTILLDKKYFAAESWKPADLRNAVCKAVTPEGENDMQVAFSENDTHIILKFRLRSFEALILSSDKQ
ncbi:MAG: carbohydrate binding domain-containing protein [Lentisphaeria bacterium]|nr:carbohydrate binding domain-containing protein [Lentisphaeria bacterium]